MGRRSLWYGAREDEQLLLGVISSSTVDTDGAREEAREMTDERFERFKAGERYNHWGYGNHWECGR